MPFNTNNISSSWSLLNLDSISCKITASNNLQTAIIYSPNDKSDFFCFEPVSHPVDAFNLPGRPGLEELASGHSMIASMSIMWK